MLTLGNVSFESESRQAKVAGKMLFLPPREAEVLEVLLKRNGRTVSQDVLESQVFGMSQNVSSNAIEVYVHRLRRMLADAGANLAIHTIRGVGYLMEVAKDDRTARGRAPARAARASSTWPSPAQSWLSLASSLAMTRWRSSSSRFWLSLSLVSTRVERHAEGDDAPGLRLGIARRQAVEAPGVRAAAFVDARPAWPASSSAPWVSSTICGRP